MRLIVTRPEPEAQTLAEALRRAGHDPIVEPMLTIRPIGGVPLALAGIDALVVTSANALRAISDHPDLDAMRRLPVYAVGAATAGTAWQLGFGKVYEGGGSAEALLPVLISRFAKGSRLLHLAGDVVAADIATPLSRSGIAFEAAIVYESVATSAFSPSLVAALRQGEVDGVLLMSPRTAATFATLVRQAGLAMETRPLVCFCISQNTAAALGDLAPPEIRIADKPDLGAVLALIDREKLQLPGRA